jgi:hypothetical protein
LPKEGYEMMKTKSPKNILGPLCKAKREELRLSVQEVCARLSEAKIDIRNTIEGVDP